MADQGGGAMTEREQLIQAFFSAFQSEALALVQQKVVTRDDCSSLVSCFARLAADTCITLRLARLGGEVTMTECELDLTDVGLRARAIHPQIGSCTGEDCWGCQRLTGAMIALRDAARAEQRERDAKIVDAGGGEGAGDG